jgi:hypothetical protein
MPDTNPDEPTTPSILAEIARLLRGAAPGLHPTTCEQLRLTSSG